MSDPFLDDESSAQDSSPIELYEIIQGATTYRYTSSDRDAVAASVIYTAIAINREPLAAPKAGEAPSLVIALPIDHAIVKRYFRMGVPPRKVTVTLKRLQRRSGLVETLWIGDVTSVACEGDGTAKLRVPARTTETMQRSLPVITAGRTCLHILYDSMCKISRDGSNGDAIPFKCATTVTALNGREVTLDLSTVPADYFARAAWTEGGELVHVSSGERQTIATQDDLDPGVSTVTRIAMHLPIPELKVGDSVEVYAGCAHDMDTCASAKFDNRQNFGGFNRLPSRNMFDPTHLGVGDIETLPKEF